MQKCLVGLLGSLAWYFDIDYDDWIYNIRQRPFSLRIWSLWQLNIHCIDAWHKHTITNMAVHTFWFCRFPKIYSSPSAVKIFVTFFRIVTIAIFMYFKLKRCTSKCHWHGDVPLIITKSMVSFRHIILPIHAWNKHANEDQIHGDPNFN